MAGMIPDDNSWKSQAFRQNVISKIEKVILDCGSPTRKNVAEMENEVFLKAKTKSEYLTFVIQMINHIKNGSKNQQMGVGPGGQMGVGQPNQSAGGLGPGQMGGGQPNIGMMGQMNSMNQMNQMGVGGVMNQQGIQQQQIVQGMQPGMQQSQQQQPGGININNQQAGGMQQQQQTGGMNMPQQLGGMNIPQQGQQLSGMNLPQQTGGMNIQQQTGGMNIQQQQPGGMNIPLVRMNISQQQPGGMGISQQPRLTMGQQSGGMTMSQTQQQPGGINNSQQPNPQQNIQMGQQQNQMINSNFMTQARMQQLQNQNQNQMNTAQAQMQQIQSQNPGMTNAQAQQQMQNQMNNSQMQQLQLIQNAQIQQAFLQQQQNQQQQQQQQQQSNQPQQSQMSNAQHQQMMSARGMPNPQMVQGRMVSGPQSNMANQLTAMAAQQRKAPQHRSMGPNAMGINRPMHAMPIYGNGLNMNDLYGPNIPQQVENVGIQNQYSGGPPGGPPMQRPAGGQFMPPSPLQMGPTPSPNPINVSGPGQSQPGFVNSPQSISHPHGSPAGPGVMRSFSNQMVPSPNTNLGTPMPMAPVPSPINAEDQACIQKIKELKKYTDLLQRMIAKIGNKDVEKSSKMKKLLEVLTNPNQRVKMEILLKCEAALQHMERQQQHDTGSVAEIASQPMPIPTKDQISPIQQIEEAILMALKNGSSSHTFLRTFKPTVEALTGQPVGRSESPDESDCDFESEREPTSDIPWVLQRDLKILDHRFHVRIKKNKDQSIPLQLFVSLSDLKLPRVPPLTILVPNDYPDESPTVIDLRKEYSSTPLFSQVAQALKSRLLYLPVRFSILELLNCWEMSVRQVSNPHPYRHHRMKLQRPSTSSSSETTGGNFALSFM